MATKMEKFVDEIISMLVVKSTPARVKRDRQVYDNLIRVELKHHFGLEECENCKGIGEVEYAYREEPLTPIELKVGRCLDCDGTGFIYGED